MNDFVAICISLGFAYILVKYIKNKIEDGKLIIDYGFSDDDLEYSFYQ